MQRIMFRNKESLKDRFSISSLFSILTIMIALIIGIVLGSLALSLTVGILGITVLAIIVFQRQDEVAATAVLLVELYVDWYLSYRVFSLLLTSVLLCVCFTTQSARRPWIEPRALWLWMSFLVLTIVPAIRGALTQRDMFIYYPQIVFGAFIIFWLGTVLGRDTASVRRFFKVLTIFGVLIALHSLIQITTGTFLFESSRVQDYIASEGYYELASNTDIYRLGSFFIQPNFAGTFFAIVIFLPLGLFVESTNFWKKICYLLAMLVMLPPLLLTYSASAWISAIVGIIVFVLLIGHDRYRLQFCLGISVAAVILFVAFPSQVGALLQHAVLPSELQSRTAVWQTAIRVIQAFPLTGVGLGHLAYLQGAEPYRVPAQYLPLDHPHNSYLEWAAMAGLPVLFVFLAVLLFALWQAFRNWVRADRSGSTLLGAGIVAVIVLSFNSWGNQGWTLPPLAALGWMILGTISSPLLAQDRSSKVSQEKTDGGSE